MNVNDAAIGINCVFPAAAIRSMAGVGIDMETVYEVTCHDKDGNHLWTERTKNRVVTVGLNKLLDATFKTGLAAPAWFIGLCGPSVTDAAITGGTNALTSATGAFTSADVGRAIIVRGAAAAGADLVTTVLGYVGATQITLAVNATTTVSGAAVIWDARAGDTMSSHSPWTDSAAYSNGTRPAFTPGTISAGSVDNSGAQATFNITVNNTLIGGLFMVDNSTVSGTTGTLYGMAPFSSIGFRQVNNGDTLSVTATLSASSV